MTGADADALSRALASGAPIDAPVVLVAAHPDDETLGAGSRLPALSRLTLIHLTDGAPEDMGDALRAGFATADAYAAARRAELDAALEALGAHPARRLAYGLRDQAVGAALPALVERLAADLAGQAAVLVHAYEGGHPDHDAAALAVHLACRRLGAAAPVRLEYAGYHGRRGRLRPNRFHRDPLRPQTVVRLDRAQAAAKRAAFAAFASQAEVLANFPVHAERFRQAPDYDWSAPCPPGETLYDRYGWALTSATWRVHADAALAAERPAEGARAA